MPATITPAGTSLVTMAPAPTTACSPIVTRTPEEVAGLVAGLEVVEPGIVPVTAWRPEPGSDEEPQETILAAVARKP